MARADAARNVDRLLAAARELVAERGAEVPMDEVAKRAGVGNATLYRHFPTRADLLVAVYADEIDRLARLGADADLFTWLDAYVEHVTTKRPLAMAATEGPPGRLPATEACAHDDAWLDRNGTDTFRRPAFGLFQSHHN